MPEYGDYKKKIKTLGDLREFANITLGDLEDDYTFDIDDDFTGVDITLCANCDVSYSEKSFYWSTNSQWCSDLTETVNKKNKLEKQARAWEIVKEKGVIVAKLRFCNNLTEYYGDGYEKFIVNPLTQQEFELLKEMLN